MNSLREKLNLIQERILGWPDNVPSWSPETDPDLAFENLEAELRQLLDQIAVLSNEERATFKQVIADFHENIQKHHIETEKRLKEMQASVDTNLQYVKAIRAYSTS
jgi:phosphoribosylanthranilate isomerase